MGHAQKYKPVHKIYSGIIKQKTYHGQGINYCNTRHITIAHKLYQCSVTKKTPFWYIQQTWCQTLVCKSTCLSNIGSVCCCNIGSVCCYTFLPHAFIAWKTSEKALPQWSVDICIYMYICMYIYTHIGNENRANYQAGYKINECWDPILWKK